MSDIDSNHSFSWRGNLISSFTQLGLHKCFDDVNMCFWDLNSQINSPLLYTWLPHDHDTICMGTIPLVTPILALKVPFSCILPKIRVHINVLP